MQKIKFILMAILSCSVAFAENPHQKEVVDSQVEKNHLEQAGKGKI